ncbi:hypothetical protein CPCC7001_2056 [Cyanobium sp. PCC 7001]|uniref:hypothetical protein n=1 Tax=Cyanobium sp. PCC 7001 TaxID=180281 RepID=UPI00018049FA|nr:hypothetical protein [Cyanobium sp. PCC 7001]EDY39176.1 hypothetical protein CPCC7001_2056 [Cyanobium sp. PCC 7001]
MRALVTSLANSLILDPLHDPEPAPWVYTAAIHSSADLVASLTGIACLTRELGFTRDPETLYAKDGRSACYHAEHGQLPLALTVNCDPVRETVSLALSGPGRDETHTWFERLEAALFGTC